MLRTLSTIGTLTLALGLAATASYAQGPDAHGDHHPAPAAGASRELPRLPENLPRWLDNTKKNHIFYKRGKYNFDVYNIPALARDLNAVSVGHALAYEDLVTGKAAGLESKTFARIDRVLKKPPKFMPDEAALSPTFGRRYGVIEQVFDWTHILHNQTVDVLASKKLSEAEKDREIERLWKYYFESVPYAITPLPMNMDFLYSLPYSRKFRNTYPKVNGLFWGYHWLQSVMYDMLYRASPEDQRAAYALIGEQYHRTELYRTDRPFMPMFGELSPNFATRFPHIANAFDNLHMLHDMLNDILATEWMTEKQKEEQVKLAIWMVSAEAHRGEQPTPKGQPEPSDRLHDHRHFDGMPGMGMMTGMTPELMWMPAMGWMSMADCHHCSMPLWEGDDAWRNATVTADGWSMRVRCALCARDMSAETKGRALLRIPTEDPYRVVVVLSDEQGYLKTSTPGVVFLESEGSHAGCDEWSRAFSSRAAFEAYVRANPRLAGAKALSFDEWAKLQGRKPDTYVKPKGPVENPYQSPGAPDN
ncbi:MAG: hypothetical protein ACK47B_03245 [Armatimonadota bacterium]